MKAQKSECVNWLKQSGQWIPQGTDLVPGAVAWLASRQVLCTCWGAVQEDRQAWSGLARLGQVKLLNTIAQITSLTISINLSSAWAFRVLLSLCRSSAEQTHWDLVLWLQQFLSNLQPPKWNALPRWREYRLVPTLDPAWIGSASTGSLHRGGKNTTTGGLT